MSNQEMQFADPDWKPSQQLDANTNQQQQEVSTPQPINSEYREQNRWSSAPTSSPQQEGYTGLRPYAGPVPRQMQGANFRQRSYSRRGRGPWFWIILAFIIFSLISGGSRFGSGFGNGPGFDRNPVEQKQMMGNPIDYTVTGQATIVINDQNGNVTVTEGKSNTDVIIQPVDRNSFPGNPNDIQQGISQNGNTITANIPDSVDLQVIVPNGANLSLNTGSGNINFDGTFDSTGTTQFQTTNGDITVTVPSSSAFHLDASTNSGSINSDFPNINIQNNTSGSGQSVNAVVGGNSQSQVPKVVIRSDSGDISLNQR
jgi:putative adhesin